MVTTKNGDVISLNTKVKVIRKGSTEGWIGEVESIFANVIGVHFKQQGHNISFNKDELETVKEIAPEKQTKMLHELIELAKAGKKFRARFSPEFQWKSPTYFESNSWVCEEITEPWEYQEIKEPRFRKEIVDMRNGNAAAGLEWMNGAKWEIVATEVIE